MIPVLLNLKGNLEMGLAARLSTEANKSEEAQTALQVTDEVVIGNVLLVQYQSIVSGLFVGLISCALGFLAHSQLNNASDLLLIITTSTATAFLSSTLTSALLAVIIVRSRQARINPDNVATPLANCLGDLSTMCVLALSSRILYALNSIFITATILMGCGIALILLAITIHRLQSVNHLMVEGWTPVVTAILISSIAGLAFERFVRYFEGLGLILTVANGICGNISSILAARLATSFQTDNQDRDRYKSAKRSLMILCTPLHLLFLTLLHFTKTGHTSVTLIYSIGHLVAANLHLALMLIWLTPNLVRALWIRKLDPDTYTMPILAALSDLSGTAIFIALFSVLWLIGDRDSNVGK